MAYDESGNRSDVVSTPVANAAGPSAAPTLGLQPARTGKGGPVKALTEAEAK